MVRPAGTEARATDAVPTRRQGNDLALVLTGGGARAAYQVGFLRCLARHMPRASIPIVTGVSAGAINAAYLAARCEALAECVEGLTELWRSLSADHVFRVDGPALTGSFLRWGLRLVSGGTRAAPEPHGLLDTSPLRGLLSRELAPRGGPIEAIRANIDRGRLDAVALSSLRYSTGQTVTWVEGADIPEWQRPHRIGRNCRLSVEHIMASAALPLVFPAVEIENDWYGDGGIRMSAPLAPAIHLGAERILAITTRYPRNREEASQPAFEGYPAPAQVAGTLLNALFLDAFDQDAIRLERINQLLERLPPGSAPGLRKIKILVLRPSRDLGRLAADYEPRLPRLFRFLTRGLGTRQSRSPDLLSLLMFQSDYLSKLIEIGEEDAEKRLGEIAALLED